LNDPTTIRVGTASIQHAAEANDCDVDEAPPQERKSNIAMSPLVSHEFILCRPEHKAEHLRVILATLFPPSAQSSRVKPSVLVFCNRKQLVRELVELVREFTVCAGLSGEMSQPDRVAALNAFASGQAHALIATDLAARGLDIKRLSYVVNYDMPVNVEQFAHRVGRTGRAGKRGHSYSLVLDTQHAVATDLLRLFEAHGRADELPLQLVALAQAPPGQPEPSADETTISREEFARRLVDTYAQVNPSKVNDVQRLVDKYYGQIAVDRLIDEIRSKYDESTEPAKGGDDQWLRDVFIEDRSLTIESHRSVRLEVTNEGADALVYRWVCEDSRFAFTPPHGELPPGFDLSVRVAFTASSQLRDRVETRAVLQLTSPTPNHGELEVLLCGLPAPLPRADDDTTKEDMQDGDQQLLLLPPCECV
jgi:superfamily II DNA/RNA helicase